MSNTNFLHQSKKLFIAANLLTLSLTANSEEVNPYRIEISRADLEAKTPMEVISSFSTIDAGGEIPLHSHHGIETAYIIQGATLINSQGKSMELKTGGTLLNIRNIVHGGFTIAPKNELKLFTVHVVDKNKPLFALPPK
jgi:quercetin dioxygenase-like cupin family protein